jgi:glutamate synthase (NADPH/NADH) small chain
LNGPAEPVSIGAIEEFLEEHALAQDEAGAVAPSNGWRVAVVGAGPAGLACADVLSRRGYAVTVFEAGEAVGGWLVKGTSPFRLDRSIVLRRTEILRRRGVEFRLGVAPGREVALADLRAGFDAVFVGPDARTPHALAVPGAQYPGVVGAIEFIETRPEGGNGTLAGRRVLVTGDDDTALDCIRTAIRRGAGEAVGLCPHAEAGLPWCRREFDDAVEEGARFVFEVAPVEVMPGEDGRVAGLRVAQTQPVPGAAGEAYPWMTVPGTEREIAADWLVVALGFDALPAPLGGDFGPLVAASGRVEVDDRQMTGLAGVFAGGDVVRGPCLVVEALRDARVAADGIAAFLSERAGRVG